MAEHDFLKEILPEVPVSFDPAAVPEAAELRRRAEALGDEGERMDLAHLEERERASFSGPPTLEELELNMLYAQFCDEVPEFLPLIERPATIMSDAVQLDLSLGQAQEANRTLLSRSRGGSLWLAAELTTRNDQVEDVLANRAGLPEVELYERDALFANVTQIRGAAEAQTEERRKRRERREKKGALRLSTARERTRATMRIESLRTAPLPLSPPRNKARKGTKGSKTTRKVEDRS